MAAVADRDWTLLPTELLGSIAKRLTVPDYIRFGAVCPSWASATSPPDLPFLPQMPWLLISGDDGESERSCTIVTLPDRRRRRVSLSPELRGKWLVGSQDGWLALLDERSEVSLFNPLTGAQIHLPSATTMPSVSPAYHPNASSPSLYFYRIRRRPFPLPDYRFVPFKKIVWAPRPAAGSYTAVAIHSVTNTAAFATAGSGGWTLLTTPRSLTDVIYHEGKFLAVSNEGELFALAVAGPSPPPATVIAKGCRVDWNPYDKYLVDSSGDLLQVWRRITSGVGVGGEMFKVMRFDPEGAAWVPLESLGDCSLFLGLCRSISLSAREVPELKRSCVYFGGDIYDWVSEGGRRRVGDNVGLFSLEDGSFDPCPPPDLRWNCPPPLWFAPNLL